MKLHSIPLPLLFAFLITPLLQAQNEATGTTQINRILFIFDASGSMAGIWNGETKFNQARDVLLDMVDSLEAEPHVEMALRVYGHQYPVPPQNCDDTRLEVPFSEAKAAQIRDVLLSIEPKGTTAIAHSLHEAVDDFPDCKSCRNSLILITDGVEACEGDPCKASEELQNLGIVMEPHVIGIGADPGFHVFFNCIGEYHNAPDEESFKEVLDEVLNEILNATTAQVNLLDDDEEPNETNVNVMFYEQGTPQVHHNLNHTLTHRASPDTLLLDHQYDYDLVAQTVPPVRLDSLVLIDGKHNMISMDTPQGYLQVVTSTGLVYERERFLVRRAGECKTINIQSIGDVEKYLTGKYDLELPIYPLMLIEGVEILESQTTTVEIPAPGLVTFVSQYVGSGAVYLVKDNGDQHWVMNFPRGKKIHTYYLQPGPYRVIFRRNDLKTTNATMVIDFQVPEGAGQHMVQLH